jgi:LuxR family maltose regulon positive regulatory protein
MTGLTMLEEDLTALEARTEGWITGLQLAAHFMQGQGAERISDFVATFTGDNRYIVDYLVEEVLSRQSQDTQTFLLQTSILDRMTGPLCDAVTGLNDSQGILEFLEQTNLFIVPLDNERQWYRYQQFFFEFLQGRLRRGQPELVPDLHGRAAGWYQAQALYEQAIDHFLAADQIEQAASLVEEAIDTTLYERGEVTTYLNWLDALPEDILLTRPRLCLAQVWALFFAGQWHKVESRLQDVERILTAEMDNDGSTSVQPVDLPTHIQEMQGEVAALRSELALFQKDFLRALELSEQALAHLPHDNLRIRGMVTQIQGYTHRLNGDVDKAQQALIEAGTLSRKVGNVNTGIFALGDLAEVQVMQNLASEHQAWPFPPTGAAYVGMGNILREWNELETATQHLHKGIELISPAGYNSVISQAYSILAFVRQAQGKSDEATEFLQQAEESALKSGAHPVGARMPMIRARLWLMQGNLEKATQWAARFEAQREQDNINLAYQRQFTEITLARVRLAQGRPDLDLLKQLLQTAQAAGWQNNVIELLILQALSFSSQGDTAQAVAPLEKALALAEPEGYVRLLVDEGAPMAGLLRIVIKQGIYPAYVGKLQASFMPSASAGKIPSQALIDPLTGRELEVLKLMATGLSNREIAAALVVALGTVAKYSNNIFTKLNVRNRTEAISRAGALDLL